jgi:hypothetical protein
VTPILIRNLVLSNSCRTYEVLEVLSNILYGPKNRSLVFLSNDSSMAEFQRRTNSSFWYSCRVNCRINHFLNWAFEAKRAFLRILAAHATSAGCLFSCRMRHTNNSVVVIPARRFSTKKVASTKSRGRSGSVA